MNWLDFVYSFLSLADAGILIFWGVWDLRKGHGRDALFLMALGLCGLGAYYLGQYKEKLLDAEIQSEKKNVAAIQAGNLNLSKRIGQEQDRRIEVERTLQAFKTLTQYSEEATAGSFSSYKKLQQLARPHTELGQRAQERIKLIQRELAYYEQPPGIVLALELSATVQGTKVRLNTLPTPNLFKLLQDETITNNTRFSLMNDICTKPLNELDQGALKLLKNSQYLPALAATTSILRRLHGKAVPFLDIVGWQTYLVHRGT